MWHHHPGDHMQTLLSDRVTFSAEWVEESVWVPGLGTDSDSDSVPCPGAGAVTGTGAGAG